MLEIILLIFLCKKIGRMAIERGLSPKRWKIYTILAWISFEFLGCALSIAFFGFDKNHLMGLMGFAIVCAFGGFLLVQYQLEKKEINQE